MERLYILSYCARELTWQFLRYSSGAVKDGTVAWNFCAGASSLAVRKHRPPQTVAGLGKA